MGDDSKRLRQDSPVETEGMGGAGGGDIDDVGDVGFPRDTGGRDVTRGRGVPEGMGGAGGGDVDDVGDVGDPDLLQEAGSFPGGTGEDIEIAGEAGDGSLDTLPEIPTGDMDVDDIPNMSSAGHEKPRGETGVVTGITTGVDTDDDAEAPDLWWENLDDGLSNSGVRERDTPT